MNNSIEIAKELKKELDQLPLFIEYKRVKSLVESNLEIKELKASIAKAKAAHNEILHSELLAKYNNHPLIVNLNSLEIELASYLKQISEIVNKK